MTNLNATIRTETGKKHNKKLIKEGNIPGVLYGRKIKSTPVFLNVKEFEKVYGEAGESTLISLQVQDKKDGAAKANTVLIRDLVRHPLLRSIIHVDFYQVPMDEEIVVAIPLVFENESPAVRDEGAVLVRNVYELEVSALPKDLPREIRADLSRLEHIGDVILAKDLALPPGVKIEAEEGFVIASAAAQEVEEMPAEPTEAPVLEGIKTEAEEKREEKAEEEKAEAAQESA